MTFEDYKRRWAKLWLPREQFPLSVWAEKNFYLSPEYSGRTGPVRLFGWQRGIFDAFTDDSVQKIHLMCGVQLVKTLLIQAALAYVIVEAPGPVLLVQPKDSAAKKFSKKRLAPMLRDCEVLNERVSRGRKDKDNTIEYKAFPGGDVTLVGAISPDNLARESIRYLFLDEVDKYPASAGAEGDPIDLAIERTVTFGSRSKIILTCSPTIHGRSRIGKAFAESDQRRPYVPCPSCKFQQVLKWEQVRWENHDPLTAKYACVGCGEQWDDPARWAACEQAEWRADKPFRGVAGFWISHLYSPWKKLSEIVRKYLEVKDDPSRYQAWWNTTLAELWEDRGEAPDHERLMSRREGYRIGTVPDGVAFLTAGVDVQKSWLEIYVWGWGRGRQRWLVDHIRIEKSPYQPEAWEALTEVLNQTYSQGHQQYSIVRMGVDSSFASNEVYQWARQQGSGRVLAMDPRQSGASMVSLPSQIGVTIGGRKIRNGCKLWPVNVSMCKSELYGLLGKDRPAEGEPYPSGWVHFPSDAPEEFFKQLTAESLVTRVVKGYKKTEWVKDPVRRNEALDCANYARAAANVFGMDRRNDDSRWWNQFGFGEAKQTGVSRPSAESPNTPQIAEALPRQTRLPVLRRSSSNFMRGFLG